MGGEGGREGGCSGGHSGEKGWRIGGGKRMGEVMRDGEGGEDKVMVAQTQIGKDSVVAGSHGN